MAGKCKDCKFWQHQDDALRGMCRNKDTIHEVQNGASVFFVAGEFGCHNYEVRPAYRLTAGQWQALSALLGLTTSANADTMRVVIEKAVANKPVWNPVTIDIATSCPMAEQIMEAATKFLAEPPYRGD